MYFRFGALSGDEVEIVRAPAAQSRVGQSSTMSTSPAGGEQKAAADDSSQAELVSLASIASRSRPLLKGKFFKLPHFAWSQLRPSRRERLAM